MAKYTIKGAAELDRRIDADLAAIRSAAAPHAAAGILLGGYGRGEGTPFILPDGTQAPFNDYDLVVVVDSTDAATRRRFQQLERALSGQVGLPVDLCPYQRSHLRKCEFSLLNYEMRHGHKVLWGPANVLDTMPDYAPKAIPLSEGARLLLNRGKLLIDIKRRLATGAPLDDEERVRFIKFIHKTWLALGDAALLETRRYDISYEVKRERIMKVCRCPQRDRVVAGYLAAVELKQWGDYHALVAFDVAVELERVISVYERFLPWYRRQYRRRECSVPKALALNLAWNKRLCARHPREALYDALPGLLRDRASMSHERFYELQRRFS